MMIEQEINLQLIKDAQRYKREKRSGKQDPTIYDTVVIARGSTLPLGPVRVETIDGIERVIIQSKLNYD